VDTLKRPASAFCESRISAKNRRSLHISRSHCATVFGSNRTQVPMRNDGILPAFACLKIVILETVNMLASSCAFNARPIRSIRSGSDIGSAVLFWGLHDCIYLLSGFTSAGTAACCWQTSCAAAHGSLLSARTGARHIYCLDLLQTCSYFPSARVGIHFRLGSESWTSNHEWGTDSIRLCTNSILTWTLSQDISLVCLSYVERYSL